AEFADRVRSRLERLRRADTKLPGTNRPRPNQPHPNQPHPNQQGTADAEDPFGGDPVIGTYHAYAGRLVSDNALREGLEPSMRLVSRYAAAKAGREVLDHGDQVALAARIASRHPEVGAAERSRYQVVLLDEYQDTSHAQLVLLRSLFGGGHPVTAVGDPCQSI